MRMLRSTRSIDPKIRKAIYSVGFVLLLSCAGEWSIGDEFTSFFQPEITTTNPRLMPYHFSPDYLYGSEYAYDYGSSVSDTSYNVDENDREWVDYCSGAVTAGEVDSLFTAPVDRNIALTRLAIRGSTPALDTVPLLSCLAKKGDKEALHYLAFAFEVNAVEPFDTWGEEERPKPGSYTSYLQTALKEAASSHPDFFTRRYQFQAIKLYGEEREYDSVIALYDRYFAKVPETAMKNWARSRKAGAELVLKDTAQSLYDFAQVFDRCNGRKSQAYLSTRINEVTFVPEALKYCQSPHERAAVYAFSALQPWQESMSLMQGLVKEDPKEEMLPLVFAREINKNEYTYYGSPHKFEPWGDYGEDSSGANYRHLQDSSRDYFVKLHDFAEARAHDAATPNKGFWNTAKAYIEILRRDFASAASSLDAAEREHDPLLADQIKLERLLSQVETIDRVTPQDEEVLMPLLRPFTVGNFRHEQAYRYCCNKMALAYEKVSEKPMKLGAFGCAGSSSQMVRHSLAKALFFHQAGNDQYSDVWNIHPDTSLPTRVLDDAIAYVEERDLTPFDTSLIAMAGATPVGLYRDRGIAALDLFDYKGSLTFFRHVPDSSWGPVSADGPATDPFWTGIRDWHDSTPAAPIAVYTAPQYAVRMIELDSLVRTHPTAETAFQLACGNYNASEYGTFYRYVAGNYMRSAGDPDESWYTGRTMDTAHVSRAKAYFLTAESLSPDKELAARARWMAAKCEQKEFLNYRQKVNYDIRHHVGWQNWYSAVSTDSLDSVLFTLQRQKYRTMFDGMRDKYMETEFAKQVIEECDYLKDYVYGDEPDFGRKRLR